MPMNKRTSRKINHTLKYNIGSTFITRGIAGQWAEVREEIRWVYKNLRHANKRQISYT